MLTGCFANELVRTIAAGGFGGRIDGEGGCIDFAGLTRDEEGEGGVWRGWRGGGQGAEEINALRESTVQTCVQGGREGSRF